MARKKRKSAHTKTTGGAHGRHKFQVPTPAKRDVWKHKAQAKGQK